MSIISRKFIHTLTIEPGSHRSYAKHSLVLSHSASIKSCQHCKFGYCLYTFGRLEWTFHKSRAKRCYSNKYIKERLTHKSDVCWHDTNFFLYFFAFFCFCLSPNAWISQYSLINSSLQLFLLFVAPLLLHAGGHARKQLYSRHWGLAKLLNSLLSPVQIFTKSPNKLHTCFPDRQIYR